MLVELEPQEIGIILNDMAEKTIRERLPLFLKLNAQLEKFNQETQAQAQLAQLRQAAQDVGKS